MRQLTVITAGLSTPSSTRAIADQIADAVRTAVSARGEAIEVSVVELKEIAVDLAQATVSAGVKSPRLEQAESTVVAADALVAVTPVFKASFTGLFKMFFDILAPKALVGMPVIVAATAGTPRHSLVLEYAVRPLFAYLRASVVPTGIFAATDDFGSAAGEALSERIARAAGELAEAVVAQKDSVGGLGGATARGVAEAPEARARAERRPATGTDQMGDFTPFSQLLAEHDGTTSGGSVH